MRFASAPWMDKQYLEWKQWDESGFGRYTARTGKYLRWHLRRAFPEHDLPLNVLEIGFGNGEFMGLCRELGFKIVGVETNVHLMARARAAGFSVASNIDEASGAGPFDLIAAFDVLEHMEGDVLECFFQSAHRMLTADGRLLVRVPNGDSPFGRRHQHGDLTHVTTFGELKFRQLAQAFGMAIVATGESPWYVDQFEAPSLKGMLRALLKLLVELVIGFLYFKERVSLETNLFVVMGRLPDDIKDA